MRPLRLVMTAFGPYAKQQVIDFGELRGQRLFLIHGPTGGGKTTILDAICYALYGETSGERKGEQMRSQFADAQTLTEVELEFAVGEKRYRVRRRPMQMRPKKKGDGMVETKPEADLAESDGLLGTGEYETTVTGDTKVRERIVQLLGFRCEQFRQVIMLPQGKFRELLLEKSEKREEILQMLFQTGLYEQLQERLSEQAKGLRDQLADAQRKRELALAQAKVVNEESLALTLSEKIAAVVLQDQAVKELREAEVKAQGALTEAQRVIGVLDELDAAKKEHERLKAREPEIKGWRKAVHAAEQAQKAVGEEQAMRDRASELAGRKQVADAAALGLRKAASINEKAASEQIKAAGHRPDADAGRQRLAKLETLRPRIVRLEKADSSLVAAKKQVAEQEAALAKEKDAIALASASAEKLAKQLGELRERAAGLESQKQLETQAQTQLAARRQLEGLQPLIPRYEKQQQRLMREREKAEQYWLKGKAHLADLLLAWKNGRAASIARDLREGEPCPVCGSREHPAPAHAAGALPSDDELTAAQQQVDTLDAAARNSATAANNQANELAQLRTREQGLRDQLGVMAGEPVATLQTRADAQNAAVEAAAAAQQQLPLVQEQLDKAAGTAKSGQQRLETFEGNLQVSRSTVAADQAMRDECLSDLPEQLRTVAAVEVEVGRVRKTIEDIESAIRLTEEEAKKAANALAGAQESERSSQAELAAAESRLKAARETFAARLQEAGFASEPEYAAARLTDAQIQGLREKIDRGEKALAAAADRVMRAEQSAAGLARPDLETVRKAHAGAKDACDAAVAQRSDLDAQRKHLADLQKRLEQIAAGFATLDAQYRVIGKMADVANGQNPKKLKLHRFVLGFLLDDVLSAATQRLRTMSHGRYQLQRMQQIEDKRIVGGLDLEVFDAHTGSARPVATLSGGESFQASLSLSLGLADVVQARSGGIRMETMFVDEGFGSLDSDALDEAIRAIQDLQKSGRTVGIISHVPELKQLIGARLEVTSGPAGSSAAFHVV